ncbi:phage major capsid family protein [Gordonia sp. MMO-8]|uniref:phage major capsid family protein n=1 Tax=Gordonia sp. MMO-8 TaxID=3127886 RepID=UPI0030160CAE
MNRGARIAELKKLGKQMLEMKAGGELTDADRATLGEYKTEIDKLTGELAQIAADADIKAAFDTVTGSASAPAEDDPGAGGGDEPKARTAGEHFVKSVGAKGLAEVKDSFGRGVSAPEFKAATSTHTVAEAVTAGVGPWMTEYDRTIVEAYRPSAQVKNLFGQGTLSGNTISYLVEGSREGNPDLTDEAGLYSQVHYISPTPVTETLHKLTAMDKLTDEAISDMDFIVSHIDGRMRYDLDWQAELKLLSGTAGLVGILNRSGVQTEAKAATDDTAQDAIFRAQTKVTIATGGKTDATVIHPLDYQNLRLQRDANEQYYGGGYFAGQYGQGGIVEDLPLWGTKTVVTPAIPQGTVLVGAFAASATVYTKGGVEVSVTNSDKDDFGHGLVAMRMSQRMLLRVHRPSGFVKVTI